MPEPPSTTERRAELSGGISGGTEFYTFATRDLPSLQPTARVLDFGCGTGNFGRFLRERFGVRPHGVDVVRHPGFDSSPYQSFQLLDLDTFDGTQLPHDWDCIFAIGLLEYLTNPRQFLRRAVTLLRPGGRLIITSPNPASLRSLFALLRSGEYSAFKAALNPASITPVLAVDARRMLQEAGLTSLELVYSNRGALPGSHGVLWQRLVPGLRGRWFSDDFRIVGTMA